MKKYFKIAFLNLFLVALFFSSCVPLKDFVYVQGENEAENIPVYESEAYKIQPNDNLYIQVISNDELSMYFNLSSTDRYLNNDAAIELGSYTVDINGEIDFPYLGIIKVAGMTTQEIKEAVSKGISERLLQYSVIVKHVNRTLSLIGEFKTPGTYSFYKDRLTIFEAIGMGRDLTDLANRHRVKVIRHQNGVKKVASLDLTDSKILTSEYYYILPNDIIYVEPAHKFYETKALSITTAILGGFSTLFNIYYILDRILIPGGAE